MQVGKRLSFVLPWIQFSSFISPISKDNTKSNNKNNNNNNTYLKWVACNNQHNKSQFFTAGPTIKRIDKIYYIIHVDIK